jgi:Undecaprenyl-phosphate glucose phosphotransferase
MELDSLALRADSAPATKRHPGTGLQPQHLAMISTGIDFVLFLGAAALSASWTVPAFHGLYSLAQVLATALLLVIFLTACRVTKVHRPGVLMLDSAIAHLAKATTAFGLPPLLALAVSLPFFASADPSVQSFLAWLKTFLVAAVGFAFASRGVFFLVFPRVTARMISPQRVAIIGSGKAARRMVDWLEASTPRLISIIGVFDDRGHDRTASTDVAAYIRGNTHDLIELYKRAPFDKVVLALPHSAEDRLLFLLKRLRQLPVDVVLAPDLIGFRSAHQGQAEIAGLKLCSLADRPLREHQRLIKDVIDRSMAALALIVLSPLLLTVAAAIKLDSKGPVLFRQPRQGLGDTLFQVLKFRTMYQDRGDTIGQQQTSRQDARITRLGHWLRRTSIDELPQLLNVLRGEMSLVGPRPHTPHMLIGNQRVFDIVDEYSFRHRVKPGITGLAQVNGHRGALETPDQVRARIDYDLYYIDHWSLWLDVKIVCRTFLICFTGVNAY